MKPLYYRHDRDGLAFASEPKALLALFPEHRNVAEASLLDFLGNNLLYARGESFYQGIHVLPPAHYAFYQADTGKLLSSRYWNYPEFADDALTAEQEARLAPKPEWTRHKMSDGLFNKMRGAIIGFEMRVTAWRSTAKLGQNKPQEARDRVADALDARGQKAMAHLMRELGK